MQSVRYTQIIPLPRATRTRAPIQRSRSW
jgi:hypothetical protein